MSGVLCDRRMKVKIKGKVCNGVRSRDMGGEEGA